MRRPIPAKAAGVYAVTQGEIIGARITAVDEGQQLRIGTSSFRVKARVGLCPRAYAIRCGVDAAGERATGIVINVAYVAGAERIQRDNCLDLIGAGVASPLIVEEEKELIFLDGPAKAGAELIAGERRPGK